MRLLGLLGLLTVLAGCTSQGALDAAPDVAGIQQVRPGPNLPTTVDQVAEVHMAEASGLTLRLGVGWGQLRLNSSSALSVRITNPDLGELGPFTDQQGDIYTPGEYTIIRLGTEEKAQDFVWMGRDAGFTGPHGSSIEAADGQLSGAGFLTVATTIPGYVIEIGTGRSPLDWELGTHPRLASSVPEPVIAQGVSLDYVRAVHQRHWLAEFPEVVDSLVYALGWHTEFSEPFVGGTQAGINSHVLTIGPAGSDEGPSGAFFPAWGLGSYFGSGSYGSEYVTRTTDMEVSMWMDESSVGNTKSADGLAAVVFPLTL